MTEHEEPQAPEDDASNPPAGGDIEPDEWTTQGDTEEIQGTDIWVDPGSSEEIQKDAGD